MKLFSKYSNLCDHDTSTSQTDGLVVAKPRSAFHRAVKTVSVMGRLLKVFTIRYDTMEKFNVD